MFWLVFQTFNTFVNPPTHKVESHNLIEVVIFSWSPSFPLTPCKLFGKKCTLHKMPLVHANQSRHIQQLFELKLPLQSNWFIWSTVEFSTQTSYVGRNPCALPPLHKYRKVMTLWEKQFSNMFSPGDGLLPKLRILLLQLSSVSVLPLESGVRRRRVVERFPIQNKLFCNYEILPKQR